MSDAKKRTTAQIDAEINAFNQEARELSAWSQQSNSRVDAGSRYVFENHEKFLALVDERFWAEWSYDVFVERRAAWNAEVLIPANKNIHPGLVARAAEAKLGYRSADIGKAKAKYVK